MIEIEFIDGTKDYIPNILRENYNNEINKLLSILNDLSVPFVLINNFYNSSAIEQKIFKKSEIRAIRYLEK